VVRELVAKDARIRLVSYARNRGRGYALRQGFAVARGDFIATVEADNTWGERIVPEMLQALQTAPGVDFIIASPNLAGGAYRNIPLGRLFRSWFGNKIFRFIFDGKVTMATGMTRCYRASVIQGMLLRSDGKEIHVEILSKAFALGFISQEIPAILAWEPGEKRGQRAGGFLKGYRLIAEHLVCGMGEIPHFILNMAGFFFLLAGFGMGVYDFIDRFLLHEQLAVQAREIYLFPFNLQFVLVFFLTGLIFFVFSMLAYQNLEMRNEVILTQQELALKRWKERLAKTNAPLKTAPRQEDT